jgi:DNA-binding response OmpR family regulator
MKSKVLVVDRDPTMGLDIIEKIRLRDVQVVFVSRVTTAIKEVRSTAYDLIILGDKISSGDTYDVGLNIKLSVTNWPGHVLCIKSRPSRTTKLVRLLRPYSMVVSRSELKDEEVHKIRSFFDTGQLAV